MGLNCVIFVLIVFQVGVLGNLKFGQFYAKNLQLNDKCTVSKTKENGTCTFVEDCPHILDQIKRSVFPTLCGFENSKELICCPEQTPSIIEEKVTGDLDTNGNRISTQSTYSGALD